MGQQSGASQFLRSGLVAQSQRDSWTARLALQETEMRPLSGYLMKLTRPPGIHLGGALRLCALALNSDGIQFRFNAKAPRRERKTQR
jgi:hypothetical protein